jgi:hypothetical protein
MPASPGSTADHRCLADGCHGRELHLRVHGADDDRDQRPDPLHLQDGDQGAGRPLLPAGSLLRDHPKRGPILKLRRPITAASTIRLFGYGPFTHFTAITDTLDTYFPINAENLPVTYAVSNLLALRRGIQGQAGLRGTRSAGASESPGYSLGDRPGLPQPLLHDARARGDAADAAERQVGSLARRNPGRD